MQRMPRQQLAGRSAAPAPVRICPRARARLNCAATFNHHPAQDRSTMGLLDLPFAVLEAVVDALPSDERRPLSLTCKRLRAAVNFRTRRVSEA